MNSNTVILVIRRSLVMTTSRAVVGASWLQILIAMHYRAVRTRGKDTGITETSGCPHILCASFLFNVLFAR